MYKICRLCCFQALERPFKFYEVVQRRYSDEVRNVDITVCSKFIQDTTQQTLSELSQVL